MKVLGFVAFVMLTAVACDSTNAVPETRGARKSALDPDESAKSPSAQAACPTDATLTQGFSGDHDGIDLGNARGTPIFAVAAGTVTASGPADGYGQWIRIEHEDGSMTEYGHMFERDVEVGAQVTAGQQIALMGDEGNSTGVHLHLRTYASAKNVGSGNGMNPIDFLSERGISIPCAPGAAPSGDAPSTDPSADGVPTSFADSMMPEGEDAT